MQAVTGISSPIGRFPNHPARSTNPNPDSTMKPTRFALPFLVLLAGALFAAEPPAAEPAATLRAADLLPAELLRGPNHRVRELVQTDGYLAHFEIDSDFGVFTAAGVPQVRQRVTEIEAIRKLVDTSKGDLFAEGMKRSLEQPIDAVKNIAKDPVGSVKRAPATVGHFFGKIGSSLERGATKVRDQIQSGDTNAEESAKGIGNAAKNAAGFDKAKLDTAKQLGVDPYSDNARLQEEMDKVTWAFFAGGLPLRIGAAAASAGIALTATNMVGIPEDTYALTQSELAMRDQQALAAMGITREDIQAFQTQPSLSTTRRHRIVRSLSAMPKTAGRGRIIQLANSCQSPGQADFLIASLGMLAQRQQSGAAAYGELKVLGRLPAAIAAGGTLEVAAPVDHVTWTEQVATFAYRDDLGAGAKCLVHTGTLSETATAGFTAAGWTVAPLPYPEM